MNIKLLAIDMDGTLLNSNKEISQRNKEALLKAKEKGVYIVLSTGRILKSAQYFADTIKLDNPIVSCNGAVVTDENRNVIFKQSMDKEIVRKIMELGLKHNIYHHFYDYNQFYASQLVDEVIEFYNPENAKKQNHYIDVNLYENIQNVMDNKDLDIFKFMFLDPDQDRLSKLRKELELIEQLTIVSSANTNVEITDKGVSKAKGLTVLAEKYNIESKDIMAIGDSENDLSMLEYAGFGVAMSNANHKVVQKADFITTSNDEEGVAKAVEKFILGMGD